MVLRVLYVFVFCCFFGCSSTKDAQNNIDITTMKKMVPNNELVLEFNWAQPLGLGNVRGIENLFPVGSNQNNINLIGNTNYFKIKKDSLYIELPYYGTQQMGVIYSPTNSGISFEGIPTKKEELFQEKKNTTILKYWVKTENDGYKMTLTFYPNKKVSLAVNSDRKTAISYQGNWKVLE